MFTDKSAIDISTEALNRSGISAPTSDQIDRTRDVFLRTIIHDIVVSPGTTFNIRLKSLQAKDVQITTEGLFKYPVPSNFDEEITLTLLDGSVSGTAQSATFTTIVLAADSSVSAGQVEGKYILVTNGTGKKELQQCTSYDSSTYTATVSTWGTTPDATSEYVVVNKLVDLGEESIQDINSNFTKGQPQYFSKISETGSEYFLLDKPPNKSTYGLLLRYYVDPLLLASDSTLMDILYSKWYAVLLEGTSALVAVDEDDSRASSYAASYSILKTNLLAKEIPFGGEFEGFEI